MFPKSVSIPLVAAALAFSPASHASADAGDFVAGALIGGIVGHAVTKESQRNRAQKQAPQTQSTVRRSTIPATQQGREIQSSLNYFGFNAGGVDGQLGRQSRAAISRYQAYMGYPATGQLTPLEEDILITSHRRAQVGSVQVTQQMVSHPDGTRGLLKTYRQELAGLSTAQVPSTPPAALPNLGVASAPAGLPNFQAVPTTASLAALCNSVSLVTNTNGGYTTAVTMTDPNVVLNEQFCLARTYAIENGQRLASQVQGLSVDQIEQQCESLAPTMATYVAQLHSVPQDQLVQTVHRFVATTGMTTSQVIGTGQICLGVGYRTDNMDVALGSALLLVGAGQAAYAELVGHHLLRGFGIAPSQLLAAGWFDRAFAAASAGVVPVFNPGEPGRTDLLRQAMARMN